MGHIQKFKEIEIGDNFYFYETAGWRNKCLKTGKREYSYEINEHEITRNVITINVLVVPYSWTVEGHRTAK